MEFGKKRIAKRSFMSFATVSNGTSESGVISAEPDLNVSALSASFIISPRLSISACTPSSFISSIVSLISS